MEQIIHNMKFNRITFLVAGILFILLGFAAPFLLVVGGLLLFLAYKTDKRYKELLNEANKPKPEPVSRVDKIKEEINTKYIFFNFKVAGVTFKNGRKTRQAILRAFRWGDEELKYCEFEEYEFEGKPAVYVKLNDQVVGNVPADKVSEFLELEKTHKRDNVNVDVYGGAKLDDGSRTNYGCEITIRYLREEL